MIALIYQSAWGALGPTLARRLIAAGNEVSVFIRKENPGDQKAGAGLPAEAVVAKSLAAALKGAGVVITLLNTPQELEDVYLGNKGILEHAAPESLFIDLSASNPRLAKELHALAAVHDHSYVEASIEGPATMLETGDFRLLAAGEPDGLKQALPLLVALTPEVVEVGLPGNGSTLKLASQIALAGALMGVVEAIMFAMAAGIPQDQILRALETNPAAAFVAQAFGKKIIDEDFYYGIELQHFFADLTTALDTADEFGLALPGLETAHQLYDLLVLVGGAKKGIHALALIYCDEERSTKHGLNWELAQQAMDVYERASNGGYDDYEYDDEECDDPNCPYHGHHLDDEPPLMGRFFSPN
ncbi:MAG: NAD(P)-dependent oxidoreductase [Coriobacteriia bacterium]|nr:NAD(P)-dependent oxidoreductase [Coriobacteriia bacterium]